jgi:transposase
MLTTEQINDLHRLYWSDHWPIRKIERHLHMGWDTIKKYLDMPAQTPAGRPRSSKLDPYKATIAELLEKDPSASAAVIGQRLRPLGFTGGGSILRQYVHEVRPQLKPQGAKAGRTLRGRLGSLRLARLPRRSAEALRFRPG